MVERCLKKIWKLYWDWDREGVWVRWGKDKESGAGDLTRAEERKMAAMILVSQRWDRQRRTSTGVMLSDTPVSPCPPVQGGRQIRVTHVVVCVTPWGTYTDMNINTVYALYLVYWSSFYATVCCDCCNHGIINPNNTPSLCIIVVRFKIGADNRPSSMLPDSMITTIIHCNDTLHGIWWYHDCDPPPDDVFENGEKFVQTRGKSLPDKSAQTTFKWSTHNRRSNRYHESNESLCGYSTLNWLNLRIFIAPMIGVRNYRLNSHCRSRQCFFGCVSSDSA